MRRLSSPLSTTGISTDYDYARALHSFLVICLFSDESYYCDLPHWEGVVCYLIAHSPAISGLIVNI